MNRFLAVLALGLLVASTIQADVIPPGAKRLPIDHKITTEKEYPDYAFYTVVGPNVSAVKFDPKNPALITGADRVRLDRFPMLCAVPKDAAKKYATEKEFFAALQDSKVEGQLNTKHQFRPSETVKVADPRKVIVLEYALEKMDAKEGLVVALKKDAPKSKDGPEEEEGVTAYTPRGGLWVAGLAGTAAVVLAGLWLARRGRRELA